MPEQIKQIIETLREQDRKSEERLNAQYKVWQDFRREIKTINERLEVAANKLDEESPEYILKDFKPMLKTYNDGKTVFSFFQHGVVKSIFIMGGIAGAIMTIRELLWRK